MKITCKVCNKEFEAEPVPQTKCGTLVCSENSVAVSTVDTTCPDCQKSEADCK